MENFSKEIKLTNNETPNLIELAKLFELCGFNRLNERSVEKLPDFLKHSSYFICAYSKKELIGFVRLFTDWVSRGFLCDLCVLPSERGKGIGQALMKEMLAVCDNKSLPVVNFSDFRKHKFYENLGFKSENSFNFMYRINPKFNPKNFF